MTAIIERERECQEIHGCLRANAGAARMNSEGEFDVAPIVELKTMQVRRLTPTECERLQGFTTWIDRVTLKICIDHQNKNVSVGAKCLRLQSNALPVGERESKGIASYAGEFLWSDQESLGAVAAFHVRISNVPTVQAVRSLGKSILPVSGAEQKNSFHRHMHQEDFAQDTVAVNQFLAQEVGFGAGEFLQLEPPSFLQENGSLYAEIFGLEKEVAVRNAENTHTKDMKYITSKAGQNSLTKELITTTWLLYVIRAINSCTHPAIPIGSSFTIMIDCESDHTAIPWKGKPAPDGLRYKALGNSMAVNVMSWIGQRIQMCNEVLKEVNTAAPVSQHHDK